MTDDLISRILSQVDREAKAQHPQHMSVGVYNASEIGHCGRAIQYSVLGEVKGETVPPEVQMIFKDGNMHETAVIDLLNRVSPVTNQQMRIGKKYKIGGSSFTVTGTLDGIFEGMVFDVKSITCFRFTKLDKIWPDEFPHYETQLRLYMDITGIHKSFILFKNKNNGELKLFYLEHDEDKLGDILLRLSTIHKGIKNKKLMNRPYKATSYNCKFCKFRMPCQRMPTESLTWKRSYASKDSLRDKLRASLKVISGKREKGQATRS